MSLLGDVLCRWRLYLLSVTSLFNIFIWRPINKKRRSRLGRDLSKFNLCVHKALHLSKWHFPISAFDSIDFPPLASSLQPFSMHGWNNKGCWVGFSVWTEHSGVLCILIVEKDRWSIKVACYALTVITTTACETGRDCTDKGNWWTSLFLDVLSLAISFIIPHFPLYWARAIITEIRMTKQEHNAASVTHQYHDN